MKIGHSPCIHKRQNHTICISHKSYTHMYFFLVRAEEALHKNNSAVFMHVWSHEHAANTPPSAYSWIQTDWLFSIRGQLIEGSNMSKKEYARVLVILFLRLSLPSFCLWRNFSFEPELKSLRAVSTPPQAVIDDLWVHWTPTHLRPLEFCAHRASQTNSVC